MAVGPRRHAGRLITTLGIALGGLACLAPTALAGSPAPFGHACEPKAGVRFCPTRNDAERVPSFDGVPIDVDVTLPGKGDGPFPTIVLMHGWGGNKANFQATSTGRSYSDVFYARRGYAVVTASARGFGRSCGRPDSRNTPACARGWLHLADSRYEARDVQHLLGLLADQGITRPRAIGVSGWSYGGIQSQILARLRDRIRLPNGRYRPWRSPRGTPMEIAAAFAVIGTPDLTASLTPNGRFLDFARFGPRVSHTPLGVKKQSYVDGLYVSGLAAGYVAPRGVDRSADLRGWKASVDAGEPYGATARGVARELTGFHSATGVTGRTPAPTLIQNGWTDDLFPASDGVRAYQELRRIRGARVSLQLGDFGHPRASNDARTVEDFNQRGARFFDAHLRGRGRLPANGKVVAYTQSCAEGRSAAGPFEASSWAALHPGRVRFGSRRGETVRSDGGDPAVGRAVDPLSAGGCAQVRAAVAPGTVVATRRVQRPFTLLGLPTVRANIRTRGRFGIVAARLWDVSGGRQRLVSRGVYRLRDNHRGRLVMQLQGNGWRFARGHTIKLELTGSDPNFVRTSDGRFTVAVRNLRVELPTRERTGRGTGG